MSGGEGDLREVQVSGALLALRMVCPHVPRTSTPFLLFYGSDVVKQHRCAECRLLLPHHMDNHWERGQGDEGPAC